MNCVFYWQLYEHSSRALDSKTLDEMKKVMNILYHKLQSQFMPSMSYDGLQIRHTFMSTIRVSAQNCFYGSYISFFNWLPRHKIALHALFLSFLPQHLYGGSDARFVVLTTVLLRIKVFIDVMLCHWASGFWCFEGFYHHHLRPFKSQRLIAF